MTDLRDNGRWRGVGEVLALVAPSALTMLNPTLMRFTDAWMVSWLGPDVSAAQLTGGMHSFIPESFAVGVLGVVGTYVSQNLGAKRYHRCGQYAWAGLWMAMGFCLLIAPLAIFARSIFELYPKEGHTPRILAMETMYFRYMVLAVFFTLTSRPLEQFFYGVHRPKVVLAASLIANGFNLVGDYVLIFGKWGFPTMGLRGAAIATVVSWALLLTILLCVFLSGRFHRVYGTRLALGARWEHVRDLFRIGWPAGLQFFNDVLPWAIFTSGIVAYFGPEHFAASAFAMRWMPLSFMPAVGVGIATTALVGRYIGEGKPHLARRRVHIALVTAMIYMGVCAVAFYVLRGPMIRFFLKYPASAGLSPQEIADQAQAILRIGGQVMICAALFQLFDAVGIVYIGALRGAGDTFVPMVLAVACSWAFTVGGSFLMILWAPSLQSLGPWIAASVSVVVLGVFMAWRFESGAWRRIDLLHRAAAVPVGAAPAGAGMPIDPPPPADIMAARPSGHTSKGPHAHGPE